ncbi:hypothetical protein RHGRI_036677 [Rhododendron griersonianum]|uniref:Uncharacterized protein n=1 Tax=Rhododendron griersonianum TaxID=479676 RepID=A0AAV6HPC8_9ERIC|nr:hypothetical protein RHGRI_036677 [Rhododendron griersonianum]
MIARSSSGEEDDDVDLSDRNKIANLTKGDQSVIDTTAEGEDGNDDVEDNNNVLTTIIAGVTLGIDFEEEDIMSVREMIEGEVQEFARLQRNRRAKRSNSFTEFQAAMLTVLSAFQLLSFGGLRVLFH